MSLESVLELARRYRSLPPPDERRRLKEKYHLTYAKMGEALGVSRECAWRGTTGCRSPRPEHQHQWVEFWEALMAMERSDRRALDPKI